MSEEKSLAVIENIEIVVPGNAEIGPVDPTEYTGFINGLNACAVEVAKKAQEQKQANAEIRQKKAENELKRDEKRQARATLFRKISKGITSATAPVTKPLGSGLAFVGMKYEAYAKAKALRIEQEDKARLKLLYNAVYPIALRMKAASGEKGSHFDIFQVMAYNNEGVHFVMAERKKYYREEVANIVVMSIWDNGNIHVRGNCDAFRDHEGKEAKTPRTDKYNYSEMKMMFWNMDDRTLTFKASCFANEKESGLEYYFSFSKSATSLLTGKVKESVLERTKEKVSLAVVSQGLYTPEHT
jgi:hypothetical protein